jgi:HSP20 family protein
MTWPRRKSDEEADPRSDPSWAWAEGMSARWRSLARVGRFHPPTDVCETDEGVVISVEIAGLNENDFDVSLANRMLTIRGIRRAPVEKVIYQQMEIPYGEFHSQVYLPWAVEEDQVDASYEKGFLRVTLRKAQTRQVPVKNKDA